MIYKGYARKVINRKFLQEEMKEEGIIGSFLRYKSNRAIWMFLRGLYWKKKFQYMGNNVRIYSNVTITGPHKIRIGKDFYLMQNSSIVCTGDEGEIKIKGNGHIASGVKIESMGKLRIGDGVEIGPNTVILSHSVDVTHGYIGAVTDAPVIKKETIIEDNVFIGANCVILPGSNIGKGAVIGAGAVVTGNINSYSIAVGVPAKEIGKRTTQHNNNTTTTITQHNTTQQQQKTTTQHKIQTKIMG